MKLSNDLTFKLFCILVLASFFLIGWTYTYDTATPLGSDAPSVIDDRIREVKQSIQERMNVEHYWPLTGTQVSDSEAGQHRYIEFYAPISTPTYAANKGFFYTKDVNSVLEFHCLDESNNEVQITSGGYIYGNNLKASSVLTASIADANITNALMADDSIDSDQYVDGSIDTAHIADANITAAKIANLTPDDYAGDGDSDSRESITYVNGMIMKTGYIARAAEVTPVAFDVAFPNGIVSVQVTPVHTTGGGVYTVYVDSVTTSGFDIEVLTDYTGFYWTAIGY